MFEWKRKKTEPFLINENFHGSGEIDSRYLTIIMNIHIRVFRFSYHHNNYIFITGVYKLDTNKLMILILPFRKSTGQKSKKKRKNKIFGLCMIPTENMNFLLVCFMWKINKFFLKGKEYNKKYYFSFKTLCCIFIVSLTTVEVFVTSII